MFSMRVCVFVNFAWSCDVEVCPSPENSEDVRTTDGPSWDSDRLTNMCLILAGFVVSKKHFHNIC
jgi:hypothetical protein